MLLDRFDQFGHDLTDGLHPADIRERQLPHLAVFIDQRLWPPFPLGLAHSVSLLDRLPCAG